MKRIIVSFVITMILSLLNISNAQDTLYVNPDAPDNPSADGSFFSPFNNIASTVKSLETIGGEVVIIDGDYDMEGKKVIINAVATDTTVVTIRPQTQYGVKLRFADRFGFHFVDTSKYIVLKGFELTGQTDQIDYWSIVAKAFWGDSSIPRNGGIAVLLDGQFISIKNNYIHDWYQKAIEIRDARYVNLEGNIIHDIARTSLTGGHGIMRQQKGIEFFDDDLPDTYRWDINENLIFNIEQTIYSWVPKKGFIEMVIDEGKSILIDDPKDTDGIHEEMSARIKNNVVAFGSVDHIRLKSTPNLEVSYNSIYAEGPNADGITDKQGDTLFLQTSTGIDTILPLFTNFICHNNASHTDGLTFSIDIDKAIDQTIEDGGTPDIVNNYGMDGKVKPNNQDSLFKLTNNELFVNPKAGNFEINPVLNLPINIGVMSSVLDSLEVKVDSFGVTVAPANYKVDHLLLTQTILDNIPGINDGVTGNDTVFTSFGIMSSNYHKITFDVVDGIWKEETESKDQQIFNLNEEYYKWYEDVDTTYQNIAGSSYERIRWGNSHVMQNQVFDPDWLTVSQITSDTNTVINGYDNDFILDGDLLIDFENVTPQSGDTFDLIIADTIFSNNTIGIFDQIHFEGFTPKSYALEIVNRIDGDQALRLTIINAFCENDITITKTENGSESEVKTLHTISSTSVITNSSLIKYKTGNSIILDPGFSCELGSELYISIGACQN